MSKKGRFKRGRGSTFIGTRAIVELEPKAIVQILETGREPRVFKSFNSVQSTIQKLKKTSGLPSYCWYELAKTGTTTQELDSGELTLKVSAWDAKLWESLDKKKEEGQQEKKGEDLGN